MENGEKPGNGEVSPMPARVMQSDTLHWIGALERWVVERAQGGLWITQDCLLREVRRVLREEHSTSPENATPMQFMDATASVVNPAYWDTIEDPGVTRFAPGEAPRDE